MKPAEIMGYHAHIYFESFRTIIRLHSLSDGPRGPHIGRMFGVDIPLDAFERVTRFLILNRGPHSILIHPLTGNELLDHTHNALWLGERQALNLAMLID
jgi:aromatic ring-cleaving dioxygenase